MVKLADTLDLGSSTTRYVGSTPTRHTRIYDRSTIWVGIHSDEYVPVVQREVEFTKKDMLKLKEYYNKNEV